MTRDATLSLFAYLPFRVNGESTSGQPKHWNQTARMFFDAEGEPQVAFDRIVNCSV